MIIASLRYHDSRASIEWLQQAFGLVRGELVENPDGSIAHSELWYGDSCVMAGQMHDVVPWHPEPGSASLYIVVDDPDAHYATARSAGADVLAEPYDTDYGSREYTVRDTEGNVWSFGSYQPKPQG